MTMRFPFWGVGGGSGFTPWSVLMWYRGSIALSASATATARYVHEVDLNAAAGNVTITVPAGLDPLYFGVVNASTVANGSKVVILQTAAAVEICRLSAAGESVWIGLNPATGAWERLAHDNPSEYQWTWADATARLATQVSAEQIDRVGYQLDIATAFVLLETSGDAWAQWGQVPWADTLNPNVVLMPSTGIAGVSIFGSVGGISLGTAAARVATNTNPATRIPRIAVNSSAVAGNIATIRQQGAVTPTVLTSFGFRHRQLCVLGAVSTNWRWFMGFYSAPITTNIDPGAAAAACAIGIGRGNGEANVQLYHGAQPGARIDLGADFPASTANQGYELILFSFDNSDVRYQVTNVATGASTSGVVAALPVGVALFWHWYASNNTDAVAVSLDPAEMVWAKVRA